MDPRVVPATLRLKVGALSPVSQHLHNHLHLGKIGRIRTVVIMSYNSIPKAIKFCYFTLILISFLKESGIKSPGIIN